MRIAAELVSLIIAVLSDGGRNLVIEGLCRQLGRHETMRRIARRTGVTHFIVDGRYGTVRGSADDGAVLAYYSDHGVWAEHTNRVAQDALKSGGVFIDIGANIGLTVKPLLQLPNITIHAFEPEPDNLENLQINVGDSDNLTIHPIALMDRPGSISFEIAEINLGDHRIHISDARGDYGEENRRTIEVTCGRLDDVIPRVDGTVVVKIDTQGAEPFVIEGGRRTLGQAQVVFVEYWPYGMARSGGDPEIVLDFISEFERAELSLDYSEKPPEPISIEDLLVRARALDGNKRTDEMDITLYR